MRPDSSVTGADLVIEGNAGVDPVSGDHARRQFRSTLGHFATGVTVITTLSDSGEDIGLTVSSFNSLSLDPPLILWSVARSSPFFSAFQIQSPFVVNVLAETQLDLAKKFGVPGRDRFLEMKVHRGLGGLSLLEGCVVYLECMTHARYPGGDHDIIVGLVRRIFNVGKAPLLFHAGTLRSLDEKK